MTHQKKYYTYPFNVRVYGIWIEHQQLLYTQETLRGKDLRKLPGGGLQYGEDMEKALKREFKEEADIDIIIKQHFYTTDFFIQSYFDNSHVVAVYFLIEGKNKGDFHTLSGHQNMDKDGVQIFRHLDLKQLKPNFFTFTSDNTVSNLIYNEYIRKG